MKENSTLKLINDLREVATKFTEKSKYLNQKDIEELLEIYMKDSWNIKRKMYGVMTNKLLNIEKKIIKAEFSVLKLLGAGGGGYFLVKFNGNNVHNSKAELENIGLKLIKIDISNEGCCTCVF